jgi:hypothetical protein
MSQRRVPSSITEDRAGRSGHKVFVWQGVEHGFCLSSHIDERDDLSSDWHVRPFLTARAARARLITEGISSCHQY